MNKFHLLSRKCIVVIFTAFIFCIFLNDVPQVTAAGETFRWTDRSILQIANGDLSQATSISVTSMTVDPALLPPGVILQESGSGVLNHNSGCTMSISAQILSDTSVRITVNPVAGSPGGVQNCSNTISGPYNASFTITGTRPVQSNEETVAQRRVSFQHTYEGSATPPSSVWIRITNTESNARISGVLNPLGGTGRLFSGSYELDEGSYTVCGDLFESYIASCRNFTKVKFSTQPVTWGSAGELAVTLPLSMTIRGTVSDLPDGIIPPITFTLYREGFPSAPFKTLDSSGTPINTGLDGGNGSLPTQITTTSYVRVNFTGIPSGGYRICVAQFSICDNITITDSITTRDHTFSTVDGTSVFNNLISGDNGEPEQSSCEDNDGEFVFFQCAIIRFANDGINSLDGYITRALEVKPDYYKNDTTASINLRSAWSNFRNIAYLLLIPILLVMVIGTALGFSFIDAYTVKRALPRLLIAVIFISVSYDICVFLIDVITIIGKGLGGLVATPFGGTEELTLSKIFNPSAASGATMLGVGIVGSIVAVGVGAVGLGILASYLLVGALALTVIFALLTLREMLIVFFIVFAPLAILSWIFPGNDKLWKLWWGTFWKLLLLYPLIVLLLMSGRAFASILQGVGSDATGLESVFLTFAKLVAYIGPFFFIPAAFKFAGGIFANLSGIVNNRSKGVFDRQRKYRGDTRKATKERAKEEAKRFENGPDWLNKRIQRGLYASSGGLAVGKKRAGRIDAAVQTSNNALRKNIGEDQAINTWAGDDDVAGAVGDIMNRDKENIKNLLRRKKYANGDESQINTKADEILKSQSLESALRTTFSATGKYTDSQGNEDVTAREATIGHVTAARKKYGNAALGQAMVLKAMAGGTYYENETDTWRAAGLAAGKDDSAHADMVVKGRQALMSAGRGEEGAGSFGKTFGLQKELARLDPSDPNNAKRLEELKFEFASHVIDNNPASTLVHPSMKAGYIEKNIVPVLQKRMDNAMKVYEETGNDELLIKETAMAENYHAQIKATKPDLANMFGEKIMGYSPNSSGGRVLSNQEEKATQASLAKYKEDVANFQQQMISYDTATQKQQADVQAGRGVDASGRITVTPIIKPTPPTKPPVLTTIRMQTFDYATDGRYQNYSRQFQGAEDQYRAQQAQATAQQGQGPGGPPVSGGPAVPKL